MISMLEAFDTYPHIDTNSYTMEGYCVKACAQDIPLCSCAPFSLCRSDHVTLTLSKDVTIKGVNDELCSRHIY
jgi:hypothetical protein